MNGINLLPWRLEKYRQQLFSFLSKMIAMLIIALVLYSTLTWFQQQQQETLNSEQEMLTQQKNRLADKIQQIAHMKQTLQNLTELQAIPSARVKQALTVLQNLPFQQGELSSFNFNDEGIRLNGFCFTQMEFESLHSYLSEQFTSTKLTQFQPEQGRLVFQFDFSLNTQAGEQ